MSQKLCEEYPLFRLSDYNIYVSTQYHERCILDSRRDWFHLFIKAYKMAANPVQVSLSAMADNRIPARASLSSDEAAGEKSDVKDGSATLPEVDNRSEEDIVREDGGVTRIDALCE